ncbi:hypothetical protein KIH39_09495 [Telmatocola sphagniphila]|jgi:hypothetical protein|uniref:Uncharacterized protein n=1 Tax=Telmatocola sphagniphila TaxID=1123043 RepID=A0A8E6EWM0_9BACT|nr:hypothetical protein [Telmatocola sphagniphila]QVL34120.1 hypothetical protein KIH39_09495 [Telmatocola sphagniphila]
MNSPPRIDRLASLNGRHEHTYEAIFRHPVAHNLEWHDVRSLLRALGDLEEEKNDSLHFSRHGQLISFHPSQRKDVSAADVLALRKFLLLTPDSPAETPSLSAAHLLVIIDHQGAKIYHTEMRGAVPQEFQPYDPHGFRQHLHSKNEETDGKRTPERKSFYEAIAQTLRGARQILIFGSGTGESNAMDHLVAELKQNHKDVAAQILSTQIVDTHHTTENELLAQAREYFASKLTS